MSFLNREYVSDDIGRSEENPLNRFSRIQWYSPQRLNPKQNGSLNPLLDGGFNIPLNALDSIYGDCFKPEAVTYGNGESSESFLFPKLHFSIIGKPITGYTYNDSFLGSFQAWRNKANIPSGIHASFKAWSFVYVKEFIEASKGQAIPFILSLSGRKAYQFTVNLNLFNKTVIKSANSLRREAGLNDKVSPFAFWLPLTSSGIVKDKLENRIIVGANIMPAWESEEVLASTLEEHAKLLELEVKEETLSHIEAEGLEEARQWHEDMKEIFEDSKSKEESDEKMTQHEAISKMNEEGFNPFEEEEAEEVAFK